jgi:ABC-type multidrug transport system ATPase subunit
MVILKNLVLYFGRNKILGPINKVFDVGLHLVTGGNGSGKSTLLNSIYGRHANYSGLLELNGSSSLLPHSCYLPEKFTVLEFINYQQALHKKEFSLCQKYLLDLMQQSIEYLSKGQRQRLVLAYVLDLDSDNILLDEPFTNIDPEWIQEFHAEFYRLSSTKCIVVSTHKPTLSGSVLCLP